MKISEIKKAAKELNELLGIEPPIDVKLKREVLLEKIKEAAELLEDGEAEDLSKSTQSILKQLSAPDKEENDEDKEDNVPAFDDLSVGEQIEEGTLDQLKTLVKAEDTFKELRRGIGIQKKADVLREKMRVAFKEEQTAPTDKKVEKKADKKEIKKAEKRAAEKDKENRKPRVRVDWATCTKFDDTSMAGFLDNLLVKGGNFKKITEKAIEESKSRKNKAFTAEGSVRSHINSRIKQGMPIELVDNKIIRK